MMRKMKKLKELKDTDYKILFELTKNSKISDRQLAKKIGVSQPTVTRRRTRLEKEGLIDYTGIPNLAKLGFEILAFNFGRWKPDTRIEQLHKEEFLKEGNKFISENPNTIFVSSGNGLNNDSITITVHKDFADYIEYKRRAREKWGRYLENLDSFIISLKSDNIIRKLSLQQLIEYVRDK